MRSGRSWCTPNRIHNLYIGPRPRKCSKYSSTNISNPLFLSVSTKSVKQLPFARAPRPLIPKPIIRLVHESAKPSHAYDFPVSLQFQLRVLLADAIASLGAPRPDPIMVPMRMKNADKAEFDSHIAVLLSNSDDKTSTNLFSESSGSELALLLAEKLKQLGTGLIENVSTLDHRVVFRACDSFLLSCVESPELLKVRAPLKAEDQLANKYVVIDYASPNIAKGTRRSLTYGIIGIKIVEFFFDGFSSYIELHVGHLRSIVQGHALVSLLRHEGAIVDGVSHVGDFGTPLGYVIEMARIENEPFMKLIETDQEVPEAQLPTPSDLSRLYVAGKNRSKTDEEFVRASLLNVRSIQLGEKSKAVKAWETIIRASRVGYNHIYEKLGVQIEERGESSYSEYLEDVIRELKEKGLVTESEGALVAFVDGQSYPLLLHHIENFHSSILASAPPSQIHLLLVRNSEGTYLYGATDLAAAKYRALYLTDAGQKTHFAQVFAIAEKAGWNQYGAKFEHIPFGVVLGETGSKMSSRDGDPYPLSLLLEKAVEETREALKVTRSLARADRASQFTTRTSTASQYTAEESEAFKSEPLRMGAVIESEEVNLDRDAALIAYNAVKYFELTNVRRHNYPFSYKAMLNSRGNTAMYLLYAYARIRYVSVFRRAKQSPPQSTEPSVVSALADAERALACRILLLPEAISRAARELEPSVLSLYLYDLARAFNHFYEHCRILGSPEQSRRLMLCKSCEVVLGKGLKILNVNTLDYI